MKSQSLNGFALFHYEKYFNEYLPKLIDMIHNGQLVADVDLGEQSYDSDGGGGLFYGLDQTYRAQEWLHSGKNVGKVVVKLQDP